MVRTTFPALTLTVVLVTALAPAAAGAPLSAGSEGRHPGVPAAPAADPDVVAEWNAIADRTVFAEAATPVPTSALYFAFVSLAVYDAVVAIEGRYQPYTPQRRVVRTADSDAAAVSAAHRVLRHHFPASAAALDRDLAASLAAMPADAGRSRGVRVGQRAADTLLALRADDGRGAAITLPPADGPGDWRPTPPAHLPMVAPWLGFVEPLLLPDVDVVPTPGPHRLTSRAYARDLREVQRYGALDGSRRSAAQTETALFWSANLVQQFQVALRDQARQRSLDIVDSARMFALVGATTADALIGCWRAKLDHASWRPVTAISEADTDGNRRTAADPDWVPLVVTPPYPEYPSGHACAVGATSTALGHLFGSRGIDLTVASGVTGTTRHYATARALEREARDARILLGIHVRKAMTDGNALGREVGRLATGTWFLPAARR